MIWLIIAAVLFVAAMIAVIYRIKSAPDVEETLNPIPFVPLPIKTPQSMEELAEANRLHLLELEARRAKHIKDSVHTNTFSRAEDDGWNSQNFSSAENIPGEVQIPRVGIVPETTTIVIESPEKS